MELVDRDREIANAKSGGVMRGVGDRCGCADDADFAGALGAHWIELVVFFVDPVRFGP